MSNTFAEFIKDLTAADVHVESAFPPAAGAKPAAKKPAPLQPDDAVDEDMNKADWSTTFIISKVDEEQQIAYGWASVIEKNGVAVVDKHGDVIEEMELVAAAHDFMTNSRTGGAMHEVMGVSHVVESLVFTKDVQKALGINLKKVGWFIGYKVTNPVVWDMIKTGALGELSIGGKALREEIV